MIAPAVVSRFTLVLAIAFAGCDSGNVGEGKVDRLRRSKDAGSSVLWVDRTTNVGAVDRSREREPNHDGATASPLGNGVRGEIDGETDVDGFRLVSPGPQVLGARVTGLAGIDLKLEVRDGEFAVIATSDRGGASVSEGVVGVPLEKGTYYVVIREMAKRKKAPRNRLDAGAGRVGVSPTYELVADLAATPPVGVEHEPNNDAGSANDLLLGESASGSIGWSADIDAWKLDASALTDGNGVDVSVTGIDDVAITVSVTDAANRLLMKAQGKPGQPVTLTGLALRSAAGTAPVYYVNVAGKPSNHETPYTLTVSGRLLEVDEEAEPNDRASTATQVRSGREEQGTMRAMIGPGETDVFAVSGSDLASLLVVAIDTPPGIDLSVKASNDRGEILADVDGGGAGASETLAALPLASGETIYVQVSAKSDQKIAVPAGYRLKWMLTADDPLPREE